MGPQDHLCYAKFVTGAFGRGPTTLSQKSMFEFKTTTPSPNDVCSEVHCQFPPFDSQCSIVDVLDTNVKRPKGKTAKCCNLFNCKNKDGSSFPFHGRRLNTILDKYLLTVQL